MWNHGYGNWLSEEEPEYKKGQGDKRKPPESEHLEQQGPCGLAEQSPETADIQNPDAAQRTQVSREAHFILSDLTRWLPRHHFVSNFSQLQLLPCHHCHHYHH
ncbi:hypothetical protein Y1Q_0006968 [Alligator mississippiensis]|uniref:Uncharacterized protein n=1 Tax=Alligator mississippiensis TaxID=8496 RepID=A0A151PBD1_ALLMI|nr:hypothetical protein Y1Q_0006968 [Alligator mississippiensis]